MYRVVLIDDERRIVEGLRKVVRWADYNCSVAGVAGNADEGAALIRELRPHILFTDIRMPGKDGLAMVAGLRSEFPDLQVAILTGYRDFAYAQEAIRLGVTRFLLKPSKMDEIKEALQAMVESLTNNASAGEYAVFSLVSAGAGYWEVAVMTLVANARYLLMSCALSQKLAPETGMGHRMLLAFDVTDEIFGVSIAFPGRLNPFYTYGAMAVAIPGWALGTFFGVVVGNVLPLRLVSALSVGLYGMFLAIIVPPARGNRVVLALVLLSFAASWAAASLPALAAMSSGVKTIVLTVAISLGAAILFPVAEEAEA